MSKEKIELNRTKYAIKAYEIIKRYKERTPMRIGEIDENIWKFDTNSISRATKTRAMNDLCELELVEKVKKSYKFGKWI